jgi:hypothetical protein
VRHLRNAVPSSFIIHFRPPPAGADCRRAAPPPAPPPAPPRDGAAPGSDRSIECPPAPPAGAAGVGAGAAAGAGSPEAGSSSTLGSVASTISRTWIPRNQAKFDTPACAGRAASGELEREQDIRGPPTAGACDTLESDFRNTLRSADSLTKIS